MDRFTYFGLLRMSSRLNRRHRLHRPPLTLTPPLWHELTARIVHSGDPCSVTGSAPCYIDGKACTSPDSCVALAVFLDKNK